MKILHIITNLELGGAQKATLNTVKWLRDKNYKVFLLTSPQGLLYTKAKKEIGMNLETVWSLRREINPVYDLISLFKIYYFIKKNKFQLVHTHSSKAGILGRWAAKLAGVKKIFHTIHGFSFNDYQFFLWRRLYIFLEKITAKITTKLIAVAPEIKKKGLKNRIGKFLQYEIIPEIVVIPPLSEDNRICPNGKFKVGMVACLKPQKDPEVFLRSARIILEKKDNISFILIGDGVLRKRLENYIKNHDLGNNFKLLGWREDAYNLMKEWDVVVLTSLWEGLPHVIIEAMSLRKTIIATAVDGIKDVIKDGENGLLFEPQNSSQLAGKILKLLDNFSLREKISLNAYKAYRESILFKPEVNLQKIEDLYKKC